MRSFIAWVCKRLSLAVVAVCSVFMILAFVTIEADLAHLGSFGVAFAGDSNAVNVLAGSANGALQPGDRIDLARLTPGQRFALQAFAVPIGSKMTVRVARAGRTVPVTLTASTPYYSRFGSIARDIGTPFCFFLSLGLATALFLIRPSPASLAFYLYAMLMLLKINEDSLDLAVWPVNAVVGLATQVIYPLTNLMILVFAKWLYGVPSRAWSRIFNIAVALSIADFLVWINPMIWLTFGALHWPGPLHALQDIVDVLLAIVVLAALAYIGSGAPAGDRARANWLVAGIALSPVLDLLWAFTNLVDTHVTQHVPVMAAVQQWSSALLAWAGLIGIAFVTYGFLAKHIVDLRIAISRAAIYAVAILVMVVLFGAIEWVVEELFATTRPAIYASLVVALIVGFCMRAVDQRVEDFLSNAFFREQRRAEESLRRAAHALANTSSETTLLEFLIDEPMRVLQLTSSALFLATGENGAFVRVAACGWTEREIATIDPEDPLVVQLRTEGAAILLEAWRREMLHFPHADRAPSVAIPLVMRGNVFGIAFYGDKGEEGRLSRDEMTLLEAIATSAAAAYDHIDAERSRSRIKELELRLRDAGLAAS